MADRFEFQGNGFTVKEIVPSDGALTAVLAAEASGAIARGLRPFVELTAVWAPPCAAIKKSFGDPRMADAFRGTHLVLVNIDDWVDQLEGAGLDRRSVPRFYRLNAAGRAEGEPIGGSAWDANTPENMAPPLKRFFSAGQEGGPSAPPPPESPAAPVAAAPPKRGFPDWYMAVLGLVAVLFVIINVAYRLGAGGISVSGADTSFNRQFDHSLYKIDDKKAFLIIKSGNVSVVKYKSGMFPFAPVCGLYELDGSVLNLADYMKGAFVYTGSPHHPGVDVVNLETGETIKVDAKRPDEIGVKVDPSTIEVYARNGLTFDPELKLTPDRVASKYKGLSAINESCMVFNAAFFLIFAVLIIIGAILGLGLLLRRNPR